jgi:hypothetical protein
MTLMNSLDIMAVTWLMVSLDLVEDRHSLLMVIIAIVVDQVDQVKLSLPTVKEKNNVRVKKTFKYGKSN